MSRRGSWARWGRLASAALAACGTGGGTSGQTGQPSGDSGTTRPSWPTGRCAWTTTRSPAFPSLAAFEEESGYTVERYREDIEDNVTFNGKVAPQLANGQNIGYDLVTPTDWLVAEWIAKGYAAEIDAANVPNNHEHPPQPQRRHLRPGPQVLTDLAVRLRRPGVEQGTRAQRTEDHRRPGAPELKNRYVVLSEMRDTIGLIMMEVRVWRSTSRSPASSSMPHSPVLEQQVDSDRSSR